MPRFLHISHPVELTARASVILTFALLLVSVLIVISIKIDPDQKEREERLKGLQMNLICYVCRKCVAKSPIGDLSECENCANIQDECEIMGWKFDVDIPKRCLGEDNMGKYIKKKSSELIKLNTKKRETGRESDSGRQQLEDATSSPPRFIVHWMLMGSIINTNETEWKVIKSCERHRSTYSVSSGPEKTFHNGGVKVLKDGLYSIYVKLTFACLEADQKHKIIFMEVTKSKEHILLRDVQEGNCSAKSDLVTMYQQGVFHLLEGDVIHARYKAPENVILPTNPYQGYKSNIGVVQIESTI